MTASLLLLPNRISLTAEDTLPEATLCQARRCRRFLAENAKSARAFLKAIGHPGPIVELEIIEIGHAPDPAQFDVWLAPLLEGVATAVVSESGCPGVADPGAELVARAAELGIAVKPLVGPCSILLTLMASGMNGQNFRFVGYLPIHEDERRAALLKLEAESRRGETELFIETPYRNSQMLAAMIELLAPDTRITVATDVTGAEEAIVTHTVRDWKTLEHTLPKLPTVFAMSARRSAQGKASHGRPTQPRTRFKPRYNKS